MSAVIHQFPTQSISPTEQYRNLAQSDKPSILTDVYREDTNIVVWKRELSDSLKNSVHEFVESNERFRLVQSVTPENTFRIINTALGDVSCKTELSENITELVAMFCDLFELQTVGLRLTTLDRAMCPKFHFDRVPCRLVTTYHGVATEWLAHASVDRTKLGTGSQGLTDEESGLYESKDLINQMNTGDVALLKGELWEGNEDAGLVHRSPAVSPGENRLLLTLDFLN